MNPTTYITGLLALLTTAALATPWGVLEVPAVLEKARLENRMCECICVVSVPYVALG